MNHLPQLAEPERAEIEAQRPIITAAPITRLISEFDRIRTINDLFVADAALSRWISEEISCGRDCPIGVKASVRIQAAIELLRRIGGER